MNSKNYSLDNSLYFLLFLFQTTRKIIKLKTFQLFLLQPTRRAAVEALNEILTNFTHTQNLLDVCEICAAAAAVSERETEEEKKLYRVQVSNQRAPSHDIDTLHSHSSVSVSALADSYVLGTSQEKKSHCRLSLKKLRFSLERLHFFLHKAAAVAVQVR